MRSQALRGSFSLVALRVTRASIPIVPASDHSAWTVPLVSIDPSSSDPRDGARESAHQTRACPQGSRGGLSAGRIDRNPKTTGAPRASSSSGELALGAVERVTRE